MLLGGSNAEKWGDHQKKKFFINNSVEVVIHIVDLAPDIMKDVFELKEPPYNLRSESNHFTRRNVKTTYYGLSSIKHLASQIWEQSLKNCKTLNEFKIKIKSWYPDHCPCRLCKTYIAQLGFI